MSDLDGKMVELERLAEIVAEARAEERVVAHCHGVFDLMHFGHIKHFQAARRSGDMLVVTLTPDRFVNKGPGRPVFDEHVRQESIASLGFVDYVAINRWPTAVETLRMIKPSLYVKGADYEVAEADITGKISDEVEAVEFGGGRLHITHEVTFSSSRLINAHFSQLQPEAKAHIESLKGRWNEQELIKRLQALAGSKVLVVGDTILDEYTQTKALGKTSKSPIVNSQWLGTQVFGGGALAIANHLAGFAGEVRLVSVLGDDDRAHWARERLDDSVEAHFVVRPGAPTTTKQRFIERFGSTKMFEISYMDDSPVPAAVESDLLSILRDEAPWADVVIVADFGHGMLTAPVIAMVQEGAQYLAVNAQTNSANYGFNLVDRYTKADYVCIDEQELRLAMHDRLAPVEQLIAPLAERTGAPRVLITQGRHGALLWEEGTFHRVPVLSDQVLDSVGAGDAVLSVTSLLSQAGCEPDLVPFIGNCMGALAVKILGNERPVAPVGLYKFITGIML